MRFFNKIWLHILIWAGMFFYFVFAPDLFLLAFARNGKPLQINSAIPVESDRIEFVVEELTPYVKDGENLYELYGWSFIAPEGNLIPNSFVREILLISNERTYNFSVRTSHRRPALPSEAADLDIDFDNLGFSALIADDAIKPGKYRIGLVFRNTLDGTAFYWDKPVYYLVKTPNTLRLERK